MKIREASFFSDLQRAVDGVGPSTFGEMRQPSQSPKEAPLTPVTWLVSTVAHRQVYVSVSGSQIRQYFVSAALGVEISSATYLLQWLFNNLNAAQQAMAKTADI